MVMEYMAIIWPYGIWIFHFDGISVPSIFYPYPLDFHQQIAGSSRIHGRDGRGHGQSAMELPWEELLAEVSEVPCFSFREMHKFNEMVRNGSVWVGYERVKNFRYSL